METKLLSAFIIRDKSMYWKSKRLTDGLVYNFWTSEKSDATFFHFPEVAQKIAGALPQRVKIESVSWAPR